MMKIRMNAIIAIMITFCFTASILMIIPIRSANSPYNPWLDYNDDGKISLQDLVSLANSYGTIGDPTKNVVVLQNSTEGAYSFVLAPNATSQNFTISTSGYAVVSLYVNAMTPFSSVTFEVFVGFRTNGVFVSTHTAAGYANWGVVIAKYPWWHMNMIGQESSFAEIYDIRFSEVLVAIWNNSTETLSGTLYYYLNT